MSREHKNRIIGIHLKWKKTSRNVQIKYKGKIYSTAQIKRAIGSKGKSVFLDEYALTTVEKYTGGCISLIVEQE
jgi:hypothetical protein